MVILVLKFHWVLLFRKCANPEEGNVLLVRVVYDCNNTQSVSSEFCSLSISKIPAGSNDQTRCEREVEVKPFQSSQLQLLVQ